ncbi:MAG TPA: hypothetical protein VFN78_00060 [Ktedonobacterales bacterium]|nr:hypothetical protein [Ktedonobacterales bacterium]
MQSSVTDTVNLAASIVTIAGGVVTLAGFIRKILPMSPAPQAPGDQRITSPMMPPAGAAPGYPSAPVYPDAQGHAAQSGYAPGSYPPVAGRPPVYTPITQPARRRIPHPVILGFAAAALVCVVIYSIEIVLAQSQTIQTGDPRFALNIALVAINFIAGGVAGVGMLVTSARAGAWGWFVVALLGLLVMLVTIGILSVVLLAPACFYALYAYPASVPVAQPLARR